MNTINSTPLTDLLAPVIITYNRADQLRLTLAAFAASSLGDLTIHVLDNASTDDTPQVVSEMQSQFKHLIYHRNTCNIGGNSNILRSVELASTPYHWVIGDDDAWLLNAETLQELAAVLSLGQADIIRLGWLVSDVSRGKVVAARQLIESEPMFFAGLSMISSTILRRSLVTASLPKAYQNINDSYPQLVAPISAVEQGPVSVYTLTRDLMIHTPSRVPGYFSGDLEWYAGWYRTSRFFSEPHLQNSFVSEITYYMCRQKPGLIREQIWLTKVLLYYKSFGLNQWPYLLSMLAYGSGRRFSVGLLLLVNLLTPAGLLSMLRKIYFKLNKLPPKTVQVDRSRL